MSERRHSRKNSSFRAIRTVGGNGPAEAVKDLYGSPPRAAAQLPSDPRTPGPIASGAAAAPAAAAPVQLPGAAAGSVVVAAPAAVAAPLEPMIKDPIAMRFDYTFFPKPAHQNTVKSLIENGLYYMTVSNNVSALASFSSAATYVYALLQEDGMSSANRTKAESLLKNILGYVESLQEKTKHLAQGGGGPKDDKNEESDWQAACEVVGCETEANDLNLTFDDVVGMKKEKETFFEALCYPLIYPNLYTVGAKGILLYGPPGTGKTYMVKAAIKELAIKFPEMAVNFFALTGADLKGKYVGETEKKIVRAYTCAARRACQKSDPGYAMKTPGETCKTCQEGIDELASIMEESGKSLKAVLEEETKPDPSGSGKQVKKYPQYISVIFIDEFDGVGGDRSKDETGFVANAVNTLLQMMDGVSSFKNVVTIAATNYPWNLDAALLRRFDTQIFCDVPGFEDIKKLVRVECVKRVELASSNQFEYCAKNLKAPKVEQRKEFIDAFKGEEKAKPSCLDPPKPRKKYCGEDLNQDKCKILNRIDFNWYLNDYSPQLLACVSEMNEKNYSNSDVSTVMRKAFNLVSESALRSGIWRIFNEPSGKSDAAGKEIMEKWYISRDTKMLGANASPIVNIIEKLASIDTRYCLNYHYPNTGKGPQLKTVRAEVDVLRALIFKKRDEGVTGAELQTLQAALERAESQAQTPIKTIVVDGRNLELFKYEPSCTEFMDLSSHSDLVYIDEDVALKPLFDTTSKKNFSGDYNVRESTITSIRYWGSSSRKLVAGDTQALALQKASIDLLNRGLVGGGAAAAIALAAKAGIGLAVAKMASMLGFSAGIEIIPVLNMATAKAVETAATVAGNQTLVSAAAGASAASLYGNQTAVAVGGAAGNAADRAANKYQETFLKMWKLDNKTAISYALCGLSGIEYENMKSAQDNNIIPFNFVNIKFIDDLPTVLTVNDTSIDEIFYDLGQVRAVRTILDRAKKVHSGKVDKRDIATYLNYDGLINVMFAKVYNMEYDMSEKPQDNINMIQINISNLSERLLQEEDGAKRATLATTLQETVDKFISILTKVKDFNFLDKQNESVSVEPIIAKWTAFKKQMPEFKYSSSTDSYFSLVNLLISISLDASQKDRMTKHFIFKLTKPPGCDCDRKATKDHHLHIEKFRLALASFSEGQTAEEVEAIAKAHQVIVDKYVAQLVADTAASAAEAAEVPSQEQVAAAGSAAGAAAAAEAFVEGTGEAVEAAVEGAGGGGAAAAAVVAAINLAAASPPRKQRGGWKCEGGLCPSTLLDLVQGQNSLVKNINYLTKAFREIASWNEDIKFLNPEDTETLVLNTELLEAENADFVSSKSYINEILSILVEYYKLVNFTTITDNKPSKSRKIIYFKATIKPFEAAWNEYKANGPMLNIKNVLYQAFNEYIIGSAKSLVVDPIRQAVKRMSRDEANLQADAEEEAEKANVLDKIETVSEKVTENNRNLFKYLLLHTTQIGICNGHSDDTFFWRLKDRANNSYGTREKYIDQFRKPAEDEEYECPGNIDIMGSKAKLTEAVTAGVASAASAVAAASTASTRAAAPAGAAAVSVSRPRGGRFTLKSENKKNKNKTRKAGGAALLPALPWLAGATLSVLVAMGLYKNASNIQNGIKKVGQAKIIGPWASELFPKGTPEQAKIVWFDIDKLRKVGEQPAMFSAGSSWKDYFGRLFTWGSESVGEALMSTRRLLNIWYTAHKLKHKDENIYMVNLVLSDMFSSSDSIKLVKPSLFTDDYFERKFPDIFLRNYIETRKKQAQAFMFINTQVPETARLVKSNLPSFINLKQVVSGPKADVDKRKFVSFFMDPSFIGTALKSYPSTYDLTVGSQLKEYADNRSKFLVAYRAGEYKDGGVKAKEIAKKVASAKLQ